MQLTFLKRASENLPLAWKIHYNNLYQSITAESTKITDKSLKQNIEKIPLSLSLISTIDHISEQELFHLCTFFSVAIQRYVYDEEPYEQIIPRQISVPFIRIIEKLGILPSISYYSMALWNWKIKDSKEPITERNIVVLYTFGKKNESLAFEWFIKIHILLELQGEEIITTMIVVKKAIEEHNSKLIQISLQKIQKSLQNVVSIIKLTKDGCPVEDFLKFRKYLSGYNDKRLFPNGVVFQDTNIVSEKTGANGSQSPFHHALYDFFEIQYQACSLGFFNKMSDYIYSPHKEILKQLKGKTSIRQYCIELQDEHLIKEYNRTISCLATYRKSHLTIVTQYLNDPEGTSSTIHREFLPLVIKNINDSRLELNKFSNSKRRNSNHDLIRTFVQIIFIIIFFICVLFPLIMQFWKC